jgi:hypothetical protein
MRPDVSKKCFISLQGAISQWRVEFFVAIAVKIPNLTKQFKTGFFTWFL